jgi:hypothetical protein
MSKKQRPYCYTACKLPSLGDNDSGVKVRKVWPIVYDGHGHSVVLVVENGIHLFAMKSSLLCNSPLLNSMYSMSGKSVDINTFMSFGATTV